MNDQSRKKNYSFYQKNTSILEKFISKEFANNIKNENIFKFDHNLEITFKSLCLIIWVKLNVEKYF